MLRSFGKTTVPPLLPRRRGPPWVAAIFVALLPLTSACDAVEELVDDLMGDVGEEEGFRVPSAEEVAVYFDYAGDLSVEISGNVAQVTVVVDRDEYARGGELWARAFPYIVLFTPGTRDALNEHPGLGGVRSVVRYGDGTLVARALLERGALTPVSWQRALNVAAEARAQGTERPGFMRDLVRWGEDHTTHEYNPEYISAP